jgi:hypothetical protein
MRLRMSLVTRWSFDLMLRLSAQEQFCSSEYRAIDATGQ